MYFKTSPQIKNSCSDGQNNELHQTLKGKNNTNPTQTLPENKIDGNTS